MSGALAAQCASEDASERAMALDDLRAMRGRWAGARQAAEARAQWALDHLTPCAVLVASACATAAACQEYVEEIDARIAALEAQS